jgi:biopolymer transport protein ExbB/TolQ
LVRCPECFAYVVDANPWRSDHNLQAVPLALVIWLLLFSLLHLTPARGIFGDLISQLILAFAVYGAIILAGKYRVTRRQILGFGLVRRLTAECGTVDTRILRQARERLNAARIGSYNQSIAFQRLRWLASATAAAGTREREALLNAFRQHSDTDWDSLETSFASIQFLIWLLPSAGFLGTVYGMTMALQHFSTVVAAGSDLSFSAGLTQTARDLGIAFHTTLVGLATVIPLLAATTLCRRRAQALLESMDKYFLRLAAEFFYDRGLSTPVTATPDERPVAAGPEVAGPEPAAAAPEPGLPSAAEAPPTTDLG